MRIKDEIPLDLVYLSQIKYDSHENPFGRQVFAPLEYLYLEDN